MTRKLTFYGASDDLFEVEGHRGDEPDEIGCFSSGTSGCSVSIRTPDGAGVQVVGVYAWADHTGTWSMGLAPLDDDMPMPPWPVSFDFKGYSARLTIEVPDDAVVTRDSEKDGD